MGEDEVAFNLTVEQHLLLAAYFRGVYDGRNAVACTKDNARDMLVHAFFHKCAATLIPAGDVPTPLRKRDCAPLVAHAEMLVKEMRGEGLNS